MARRTPLHTQAALVAALLLSSVASLAGAQYPGEMDPTKLNPEQKELLNYAYLTQRLDLLPAIQATGDQVVVVLNARQSINYIQTLSRTHQGEAILQGGGGAGPGMVKIVLQHLAPVRDVLSEEQRQAFKKLMTDQKLVPITIDATDGHFLVRYTFGPNDKVEKAKAKNGRIIDVVVPDKDDSRKWHNELKTGEDLIRLLENKDPKVHRHSGDWLIEHGAGKLDPATKKTLADLMLKYAEAGAPPSDGFWMHAYCHVAQPEHERRVLTLVEKCSIHNVAGMIAAYAAVAPAKALAYVAKPRSDKNYPIRAVQGLALAPDGLRLLQLARVKMPDMAWKIDGEIKSLQERAKLRAQGKPENPGLAELEARRKAEKEALAKSREGKKPGDYQGFDDWFADLSGSDRQNIRKAQSHFVGSVYAPDLSKVKPEQRSAVFKLMLAAWSVKRHALAEHEAGPILIAAASLSDTQTLLDMINPETKAPHFPLAALIRTNPQRAEQVILGIIAGQPKFRISPTREAVRLVPAEALPMLEQTLPKLKDRFAREILEQLIALAKEQLEKLR